LSLDANEAFKAGDMGRFTAGMRALSAAAPLPYKLEAGDDGNFRVLFRSDKEGGWSDTGRTLTPQESLPESNLLRDLVCYGFPSLGGVSIGGSLQMDTPFKDGLRKGGTPKEILTESLGGILGIPYDLVIEKPSKIMEFAKRGEVWRAVEEAMPTIVKNGMQAWRLYTRGQTTASGKPVNTPGKAGARRLTEAEAAAKALGFQSTSAAKSYDAYLAQKTADKARSEKVAELAELGLEADRQSKGRAAMLREWRAWNERMTAGGKKRMIIRMNELERRITAEKRNEKGKRPSAKDRLKGEEYGQVWGL
jgi:hypothetical protein